MKNINLVTGFWYARDDRDEDRYLNNFKNVLSIPHNMTVFIPKKYESIVKDCRKDLLDITDINILELEQIKTKYFSKYWDNLQKIRTNPHWIYSTEWLKRVPQCFSEWYNPIVMSKVFFVNESYKKNVFNSDKYIWVDAGITQHIPKEFVSKNSIQNMAKYIKTTLFTAFEYKNAYEVHGFHYDGFRKYTNKIPEWCCRATIFGCDKECIPKFNEDYGYYLNDTLSRGYLGTEESIFTLLSILDSELYRTYNMGNISMPVKFLEDMDNNTEIFFN